MNSVLLGLDQNAGDIPWSVRLAAGGGGYLYWPGDLSVAGLAVLLVSGVLCFVWMIFLIRRRRLFPFLGGTAIILAAVGYLVWDWRHILLDLSMRDAQSVREDCERLLQRCKNTFGDGSDTGLRLSHAELPPSFIRLGAKEAVATPKKVYICLFFNRNGRAWGFLYDPHRSYVTDGLPHDVVRATWYRDFYEFFGRGE